MFQAPNSPTLRTLFQSVKSRRGRLTASITLALLSAATGIVTPLLVAKLITSLGKHTSLMLTVIELVAIVLAGAFAGGWSAYLLSSVGERAVADVRIAMVRHVVRLPVSTVRRLGSGELISRVGVDAAQLRSITDTGVTGLPVALVMVCAYLAVMGILDWVMLLVVIGTFAFASIAIRAFLVGMRQGTQAQQEALGRLAQCAQSVFSMVTTVKAFRAEDRAVAPIVEQTDRAASAAIRSARSQAAISPLMGLGQQIAIVGVLAVGGARMASGALTVPHFIAFLMYLFQLVSPLMTLAQGAGRIQLGAAAANRMDMVLSAPPELRPTGALPAIQRHGLALELRDVELNIDGTDVLTGLSLEVPRTGVVAIVGQSGAGKSTVLNLMERFAIADSGSIELLGADLADWPLDAARQRMALVEQGSSILNATIRQNLLIGRPEDATEDEMYEVLRAVGLEATIRALPDGLDAVLGQTVQLSGGEQQRLAVARALLADADILLLDEPSSALDGVNETRLVNLLERFSRDRAVVVVAHRLSTIRNADTIVVMDAGRVIASGSHLKLMATCPAYQALAHTQEPGPAGQEGQSGSAADNAAQPVGNVVQLGRRLVASSGR